MLCKVALVEMGGEFFPFKVMALFKGSFPGESVSGTIQHSDRDRATARERSPLLQL